MRTGLLTALIVVSLLGLPFPATGTEVAPAARPGGARPGGLTHGAKALLDRGMAALEAHDLPTATRLLTDAYRQSQRAEVLYHLGRLAVAESRTLDAYDLMRRYLADPAREPSEAATQAAEQLVSQPPPPSGSLTVLSDPGALVLVDDRAVATLPLLLPLLVAPGTHIVKLEFPAKQMEAPVQAELSRLTEVRMSRASGTVLVSVLPAILLCAPATGLPGDAGRLLVDAIEGAARDEQYTLLRADLLLAKGEPAQRCLLQESCQRELAAKNKLTLVLQQTVQVQGAAARPTWQLALRLLRAGITEPAATRHKTCDGCSAQQAAALLKAEAATLLTDGLARPAGTLNLTTAPATATVRIGERAVPTGPYTEAVWAGSYQVTASQPGYQPEQRSVTVADGQNAELHLELQPLSGPAPPLAALPTGRTQRPRWRLAVGGTMLGLGVALIATGVAGVAVDGHCAPLDDARDPCPTLFSTVASGGFSLASGLLLVGSGGLLIGLPATRHY